MRALFSASLLNAANLAVRFATGLLTNKLIAILLGPAGLAVYAQLQNLQAMLSGIAAAPGQSGIVRLTAAAGDDGVLVQRAWSAALRAILALCVLVVLAGVVMAAPAAERLLGQGGLVLPFLCFVLSIPAVSLSALLYSCANGKGDIKGMTIAGIFSTVASGLMGALGVWLHGLPGLIYGVALGQLVLLLVSYVLLSRREWFSWQYFVAATDMPALRQVMGLAGMTLVAVVCVPLSQLAVRHLMVDMSGWEATGHWQAISKLGDLYVMVVTSLMGVYYLPRFSAIRELPELHAELKTFFLTVFPLFVAGYAGILLFRELVIQLVFSASFLPAATLFPAQMAADVARMLAWLAGYLLMARGSPVFFMVTEVLGCSLTVLLSWWFMQTQGVVGAQYAALVVNLVYALVLTGFLRHKGHI